MHTKQLSKDNLILENTGTVCSPPHECLAEHKRHSCKEGCASLKGR